MAKKQPKAFTDSVPVVKVPTGGTTIPQTDYIKTSLILRRQDGGGASEADVAKVYDFLAQNHIATIEGSTREETLRTRMVNVGATLQDYKLAGIDPGALRMVKKEGISHRVRSGSLKLPAALHSVLLSWTGFDTQPTAKPHARFLRGKKALAQAAKKGGSFSTPALAKLYGFPTSTLTGKGQTIAIIELNNFDSQTHQPTGTGFTSADLDAYFKSIKMKTPTVIPVGVLGGGNVPGPDANADGEVALDIEVAGAVAPEATIVVYFAPNTDRGFVSAIHAAVFDQVHKPSVISISWGSAEDFGKKQYIAAMQAVMQDAAANKVTVFAAAGDAGSSDVDPDDGKPHADLPGCFAETVCCGGLRTGHDLAEAIWNNGPSGGAGGGGVSNIVKKPAYQNGLTVPKSPKGFTGRGVPDVSGAADPQTGYQVVVGGRKETIGGTSAVAPLYAGLLALINQSRAAKGKAPAGDIHATVYATPEAFRDIVQGDNDMNGNLKKYSATTGWDPCSGLGSPIGDKLLAALG